MVDQVLAHLGHVAHDVDAVLGEVLAIADAGQHQQLRAVDGAAAQHHLATGAHHAALAALAEFDARPRAVRRTAPGSRWPR